MSVTLFNAQIKRPETQWQNYAHRADADVCAQTGGGAC